MNEVIYNYSDYKRYLKESVQSMPRRGRGARAAMAEAMKIQTAYVSQVLNGAAHFSLEQGQAISRYLKHTKDEEHYFLLLIQLARAGNQNLRIYFQEQINQLLEKRLVLRDRLGVAKGLSAEDQAIYYSSWHYAAVHIAIEIPKLQTAEAICSFFGLSTERILDVLRFLTRSGLVIYSENKYQVGKNRIHLGSDSPYIIRHHTNWRLRAIQCLERGGNQDLHYSSVVGLSKKDALEIKAMLVREIERVKAVIKDSPSEMIWSFSLDFFQPLESS